MCSPHGSTTSCALRSNLPLPSFRGRHSGAAKVVWPSVAHVIPEWLQQGCYGHSNTHGDTIGDIIWQLSTTDIQQTFMASRESLHANVKHLPGKRWLGIDHFISTHYFRPWKKTDDIGGRDPSTIKHGSWFLPKTSLRSLIAMKSGDFPSFPVAVWVICLLDVSQKKSKVLDFLVLFGAFRRNPTWWTVTPSGCHWL